MSLLNIFGYLPDYTSSHPIFVVAAVRISNPRIFEVEKFCRILFLIACGFLTCLVPGTTSGAPICRKFELFSQMCTVTSNTEVCQKQ
jgi:hypothetical protein